MTEPKYEKMSKSRGNVVLPEEVVYGVMDWDAGYEFRMAAEPDAELQAIDPLEFGVWRDKLKTGYFYSATRFGRLPVFLHEKGNPVPTLLLLNGEEHMQHPFFLRAWEWVAKQYDKGETKETSQELPSAS